MSEQRRSERNRRTEGDPSHPPPDAQRITPSSGSSLLGPRASRVENGQHMPPSMTTRPHSQASQLASRQATTGSNFSHDPFGRQQYNRTEDPTLSHWFGDQYRDPALLSNMLPNRHFPPPVGQQPSGHLHDGIPRPMNSYPPYGDVPRPVARTSPPVAPRRNAGHSGLLPTQSATPYRQGYSAGSTAANDSDAVDYYEQRARALLSQRHQN